MCKFWGNLSTEKISGRNFRKFRWGGPDPQTAPNILTWLGGFVGDVDPRPTVPVISCQAQSFPRNWASKKNLWRHLASKPEVGRSRDSTRRRGSTGSTSCQNLGIFGRPVSKLSNVEFSVELPEGQKFQIAGENTRTHTVTKVRTTEGKNGHLGSVQTKPEAEIWRKHVQ